VSTVPPGPTVIPPVPNGPREPSSDEDDPALSVPPSTVVPPEYVFCPDSVSVPGPSFTSAPPPESVPEYSESPVMSIVRDRPAGSVSGWSPENVPASMIVSGATGSLSAAWSALRSMSIPGPSNTTSLPPMTSQPSPRARPPGETTVMSGRSTTWVRVFVTVNSSGMIRSAPGSTFTGPVPKGPVEGWPGRETESLPAVSEPSDRSVPPE
jgi:hypothetical protein